MAYITCTYQRFDGPKPILYTKMRANGESSHCDYNIKYCILDNIYNLEWIKYKARQL